MPIDQKNERHMWGGSCGQARRSIAGGTIVAGGMPQAASRAKFARNGCHSCLRLRKAQALTRRAAALSTASSGASANPGAGRLHGALRGNNPIRGIEARLLGEAGLLTRPLQRCYAEKTPLAAFTGSSTMSDSPPRMPRPMRILVYLAVGGVVGLLGASAFADAAGIDEDHREGGLRVLCGFVLGFATIAVLAVAAHLGSLGVAALRQSSHRPSQAMAITLVICGAVCILTAMAFEWYIVASSQVIRPTTGGGPQGSVSVNVPGMTEHKATISVSGSGQVHLGTAPSPVSHIVALCGFLAGAVLIGLGVWSSVSAKPEVAWDARAATAPAVSA
jgi:hypothetical protein